MPRLMEKKDWMQTVANVSAAESVLCENITSDDETVPLPLPGRGSYQVILVKIGRRQHSEPGPRHRSAREFIGCCKDNYNGLRTTSEIMKELREGEE